MSNYSTGNRTPRVDTMPEQTNNKTNNDESVAPVRRGCIDENTCACGEKHEHHEGDGQPPGILHVPSEIWKFLLLRTR